MNEETNDNKFRYKNTIIVITGFVIIVWTANLILPIVYANYNWADSGIFGDMFGASNSLFSALAFIGLIIAILLQKEELSLQRKELKQTRVEIAGQKEQLEGQKNQMELQNFDNKFFQLISLINNFVQQLKVGRGEFAIEGRKCFDEHLRSVKKYYPATRNKYPEFKESDLIRESFSKEFHKSDPSIVSYTRILFSIFRLISQQKIADDQKQFYANIVIAMLSHAELKYIFYHRIYSANDEFREYIEEFGVFRNLDKNQLIDTSHPSLYSNSAYESKD